MVRASILKVVRYAVSIGSSLVEVSADKDAVGVCVRLFHTEYLSSSISSSIFTRTLCCTLLSYSKRTNLRISFT